MGAPTHCVGLRRRKHAHSWRMRRRAIVDHATRKRTQYKLPVTPRTSDGSPHLRAACNIRLMQCDTRLIKYNKRLTYATYALCSPTCDLYNATRALYMQQAPYSAGRATQDAARSVHHAVNDRRQGVPCLRSRASQSLSISNGTDVHSDRSASSTSGRAAGWQARVARLRWCKLVALHGCQV